MTQILNMAYKLLAQRDYSERELRQKLQYKGCSSTEADWVITELFKQHLLDDAKLGKRLFEKYCRRNQYSLNAIAGKLRQHGLSSDIICQVITEADPYDEFAVAFRLAKARYKNTGDLLRLSSFLYARGFKQSTVTGIVDHFNDL
jgi:regulatory protein